MKLTFQKPGLLSDKSNQWSCIRHNIQGSVGSNCKGEISFYFYFDSWDILRLSQQAVLCRLDCSDKYEVRPNMCAIWKDHVQYEVHDRSFAEFWALASGIEPGAQYSALWSCRTVNIQRTSVEDAKIHLQYLSHSVRRRYSWLACSVARSYSRSRLQ